VAALETFEVTFDESESFLAGFDAEDPIVRRRVKEERARCWWEGSKKFDSQNYKSL